MHDCKPPSRAISRWLRSYPSPTVEGRYGHLLLEEKADRDPNLAAALVPYFESAHRDAREHFALQIGIDLHPDADEDDDDAARLLYPGCLPPTAKRGLFGEVMAGLVTEHYEFVGEHEWSIPIFLFRYHADVEKYLFDLARDPARVRAVFGRFGSDFLGISLDEEGGVSRLIVGEAKWRETLNASTVENLMLGEWKRNRRTGERVRKGGVSPRCQNPGVVGINPKRPNEHSSNIRLERLGFKRRKSCEDAEIISASSQDWFPEITGSAAMRLAEASL